MFIWRTSLWRTYILVWRLFLLSIPIKPHKLSFLLVQELNYVNKQLFLLLTMHLYWKYNHFGKSWYQVMKSIATLARVFKNPPSANYTSKTTRHLTGFRSASWRRSDRQVCLGVTVRWGPKFWHSPVSKTQTENDFTKYTWPSDLQWVVFPNSLMGESAVKYRVMISAG